MTLSKAVFSICRDVLFIWLYAVDVLLSQSWPSFLPRGDCTPLPRSRAVLLRGLGFAFLCQASARWTAPWAGALLLAVPRWQRAVLRRAGASELGSAGFSSKNHDAPTPSITQHAIAQGQSYASLLPLVPLGPSNPPHLHLPHFPPEPSSYRSRDYPPKAISGRRPNHGVS